MGILKNDSEGTTKRIFLNQFNIDSIIGDHSWLDVIEAVDQVGDGCLPCTSRSDKGHFLTLIRIEIDTMKNLFLPIIREINIIKDHISNHLHKLVIPIWTWVFPSPFVGFLISFDHFSIDQFIIDQRHFSLVDFFFFIQEIKDTISTSQSHQDKVQLLRDLGDGTREGTVQLQEGHETTNG